ncbi:MAG TPA: putative transporter [Candidatus Barnesiella excrementipullorum]|uniref:Transporter n=1 Tax=Candidatus Barnesiella excrementipullorum TaxID=2838479 RepID=A0A9D1VR75_9BACT|nr:putative transporter [Candidatus Barnesiella excrementipullorum]
MEWIVELFTGTSIAHTAFLYALVIAAGVLLGRVKIFGVSLGVTFVLFVGILMGHFGLAIDAPILNFMKEFGLILFVFSIGMQVGPGFFSSFKHEGIRLNFLAIAIIALNIIVTLAIYFLDGSIEMPMLVGILSGAVTNTPGLGAAEQALSQLYQDGIISEVPKIALGYAVAYPLGVIGIILAMILVRLVFRVKYADETAMIEKENADSLLIPHVVTYKVENKLIVGRTLSDLGVMINRNFVVSRIKRNDEIIIPSSDVVIEHNDLLLTVLSEPDEEALSAFIGPKIEMDWKAIPAPVVSRRILVSKEEFNGRKIGSLRLRMGYRLNVTRVNRAGVDLLASPNLSLQVGDRLTVVGKIEDIERLAEHLGNSMQRLNQPNIFTIFIGILIGIVFGSIPFAIPGMPVPLKLGLAGGPLIVAILIGRYGYKMGLTTYTSTSANLMLREVGICMFLASVGIGAGSEFVATVKSGGLMWILWGFLITFIPLLIVGLFGRGYYKLNYYTLSGLMAGSYTDPPALAYSNKVANNDAPAVAYSTVYPLSMFLRVLTAQILVLAFA